MWYSVELLYQRLHENDSGTEPLWEESIVLVNAQNEIEARAEGERIGRVQEHQYKAISGDVVKWVFLQVVETQEILEDTLGHKTEVFSRFLRQAEVAKLTHKMGMKVPDKNRKRVRPG